MKKDSLILPAIILCIICLVTTGLVSLTYTLTADARAAQADTSANANRRQLCPQATSFKEITLTDEQKKTGIVEAFVAQDANAQDIAWLFTAQARGYAGEVPVLVVITADGKISGIKTLDNSETPGLGKKVAEPAFYGQFVGQTIDKVFAVNSTIETQHKIDAIIGATISSNAVTRAVNLAIAFYQQNYAGVK